MRGYSFAAFQGRTTCTWRKKIPLITLHCRGTAGEEGNNKQMTLRNKKAIMYACVGFWGKIGKGEVEVCWFDILHPSHTVAAGVTVVARWPRITLVRNSRTEVVQIMFAQKTQIVSVRVSAACYVAPPFMYWTKTQQKDVGSAECSIWVGAEERLDLKMQIA